MTTSGTPSSMRRSGLELFRILTMLFILAHHYVVHSGLLDPSSPVAQDPLSFRSQFMLLFGAWGKTGINCFILFAGYFMCDRSITLRKFLKLLCEILFYKLLLTLVFVLAGYERLSLAGLVKTLLPVRDLNTDFYGGYLVFFLFIPFLNILVRHMDERSHIRLLALLSFVCVFLGTVPGFSVTLNNAAWFMALYILSSWIRLYPKKLFDNARFWKLAAAACILVSALSVVVCSRFGAARGKGLAFAWRFVMDSNSLLAVLTALSSFMLFRLLKIPQSRFINAVASTTFGVLLLHTGSAALIRWLWTDLLRTVPAHAAGNGILHALLAVPAVFIAAACVDFLRIRFVEKPFFRALDKVLPGLVSRWRRFEEKLFSRFHIS